MNICKKTITMLLGCMLLLLAACGNSDDNSGERAVLSQVEGYFEEADQRAFTVTYPLVLDGKNLYQVDVSGLTQSESYPIDRFAVNLDTGEQYFYNAESGLFGPFFTQPLFACTTAPTAPLRMESLGMYEDGPSGMHALKQMWLIDTQSGAVLWQGDSFLNNKFLWSSDSRFVAIQYSGRTWTQTMILDTAACVVIDLPSAYDIAPEHSYVAAPDEGNDYSVLTIGEWLSDDTLLVNIEWPTADGTYVTGQYQFSVQQSGARNVVLEESTYG